MDLVLNEVSNGKPALEDVPVSQHKKRNLACALTTTILAITTIAIGAVVVISQKSLSPIAPITGVSDELEREDTRVERKVRSSTESIFCVIADTPYNPTQRSEMKVQLNNMASDCEFVVHLGDIKSGKTSCIEYIYQDTRSLLLRSHAPVFIVPGDNEWNDCPWDQISSGWKYWNTYLHRITDQWSHSFTIKRLSSRPENLYFVHKRTLFVMINVVGGQVISDWDERQSEVASFTINAISKTVLTGLASGVVIMGHAHPYSKHDTYFDPLMKYINGKSALRNTPFLYLHGDGHEWEWERGFNGASNFLRMQTVGGTDDLPLKMMVDPYTQGMSLTNAFWYDRSY